MDLLSIIQTLWRYKMITIPVLILTMLGAVYVVKIKPPVYQADASILLTNPPGQATPSQIAQNPELKTTSPYNTYVDYGSLDVVANTIMDIVRSAAQQAPLMADGAGSKYQLALSTDYGNPPIIQITGVGASPQAAITSASAVIKGLKSALYQLQVSKGVNPFYMITAVDIVKPTDAGKSSSGNLRSLVGVLAGGIILLFAAISVMDAVERRRRVAGGPRSTGGWRPTGSWRITGSFRSKPEKRGKSPQAGNDDGDWPDSGRGYPVDDTEMPDAGRPYRDRGGYYRDEAPARMGADDRRPANGSRPEGSGRDGDGSGSRREQSWGYRG